MALEVTPDQVPALIPGAPYPEAAHVSLALMWARLELARRRVEADSLTGDALLAAQTAVEARALALKAGIGGVISLEGTASGGGLKGIKLPGIELALAPTTTDTRGNAVVAAGDWDALALQFLELAVPARPRAALFPGAAR